MLKFTERPKTPGITLKKHGFPVIFVLIWMKPTLICFSLQRDGTENGLSNIKDTFVESLKLQMSVLHQSMCIFKAGLSISYDCWAKYKKKYLMCQIPIKMFKQHAIPTQVYIT